MKDIDYLKIFGKQVQYFRKKANLSQEKLAEKLNTNSQSISRIENGKYFVKYPTLKNLCEVLNVEAWQLFISDTSTNINNSQNKLSSIVNKLPKDKQDLLYQIAITFLK